MYLLSQQHGDLQGTCTCYHVANDLDGVICRVHVPAITVICEVVVPAHDLRTCIRLKWRWHVPAISSMVHIIM